MSRVPPKRRSAASSFDLPKLAVELATRFNVTVKEVAGDLAQADKRGELRTHLARLWRIDRFTRFKNQQLPNRKWINFREIVDWCSELGGNAERDQARRINAYNWLQEDLLAGDFEDAAGKSRVLYLHHRSTSIRMYRDKWLSIVSTHSADIARSRFLDHCWLERSMFQLWLAKHELPLSPSRFESRQYSVIEDATGANIGTAKVHPIDKASGATSKMPRRPNKPGPRQAAWDALAKRFPGKRTPDKMSGRTLQDIVNRYVSVQHDVIEGRIRDEVSLDTVLRAAGRRK